jgi:hypothetical protein
MKAISKILSENDVGETGAHQAGILVPKSQEILSFFPSLNPKEKNPRAFLSFNDESGSKWEFVFIYYNNKFSGGTRNEYRLTRMTRFFSSQNIKPGDELILLRDEEGIRRIKYRRSSAPFHDKNILKLGTGWKVISFRS